MGLSCTSHGAQPPPSKEALTQIKEANSSFTFLGSPINPRGVKLLLPWISDGDLPGAASIYLEGTAASTNQFQAEVIREKNGRVSANYQKENSATGHFSYQHLGILANGSHVLETWDSDDRSSGVWTDLLLVKFDLEPQYQEDGSVQYRIVLTRVGDFVLGDRYGGSVTVQPHRISIEDDHGFHHDPVGRAINFK
jgi:hypothetical protein